ncbi:MAG: hypothetical protein WA383_02355 [Terriglobales bacterium]
MPLKLTRITEPFSFDQLALRMSFKQDVPQELESLLVEAFSNDKKIGAEFECLQLRAVQFRGPIRQPLGRLSRVFNCVPERGHQVRFALTPPAEQHNGARFVRLRCLEDAHEVNGWVGYAQKSGRRLLEGARRLVGGEINRRPFEALPFELLP